MRAQRATKAPAPEGDGTPAPAPVSPPVPVQVQTSDAELEALAAAELDALHVPDKGLWAEVDAAAQALFLERQTEETETPSAGAKCRRGADGLTNAQRRMLYDPARYNVE